ncbi:hypothetical protein JYU34_005726 [Plutella xylostella]|uniref:Uncharacterized protein n=1 Tax=Plutella xylostella TaxID=51655 RepID=A0ABQ7QNK8_PLUXY|nr:hypothetical protein JYU34_008001 [Plutella xylostella]KAG7308514.1 hypothetical protein JYU34_005726 [Plutella xylostella]
MVDFSSCWTPTPRKPNHRIDRPKTSDAEAAAESVLHVAGPGGESAPRMDFVDGSCTLQNDRRSERTVVTGHHEVAPQSRVVKI